MDCHAGGKEDSKFGHEKVVNIGDHEKSSNSKLGGHLNNFKSFYCSGPEDRDEDEC